MALVVDGTLVYSKQENEAYSRTAVFRGLSVHPILEEWGQPSSRVSMARVMGETTHRASLLIFMPISFSLNFSACHIRKDFHLLFCKKLLASSIWDTQTSDHDTSSSCNFLDWTEFRSNWLSARAWKSVPIMSAALT